VHSAPYRGGLSFPIFWLGELPYALALAPCLLVGELGLFCRKMVLVPWVFASAFWTLSGRIVFFWLGELPYALAIASCLLVGGVGLICRKMGLVHWVFASAFCTLSGRIVFSYILAWRASLCPRSCSLSLSRRARVFLQLDPMSTRIQTRSLALRKIRHVS
jgi:hypothetical protein